MLLNIKTDMMSPKTRVNTIKLQNVNPTADEVVYTYICGT